MQNGTVVFVDELKAAVRVSRRRRHASVVKKEALSQTEITAESSKNEGTPPSNSSRANATAEQRALALIEAWCMAATELESQDILEEDALAGGFFLFRQAVGDDEWALPCLDAWRQCVAHICKRRDAMISAEWCAIMNQRLTTAISVHSTKQKGRLLSNLLRLSIDACSLPGDKVWASVLVFHKNKLMQALALDEHGKLILHEESNKQYDHCLEAQLLCNNNPTGEAYLAIQLGENSAALDTMSAKIDNRAVLTLLVKGGVDDTSLFEARRQNFSRITNELAHIFFDNSLLARLVTKAIHTKLRFAFCRLRHIVNRLKVSDTILLAAATDKAFHCLVEACMHTSAAASKALVFATQARGLVAALKSASKHERQLTRRAAAVSARCRQLEVQNRTLVDELRTIHAATNRIPSASDHFVQSTLLTPTSSTVSPVVNKKEHDSTSPLTPTSTPTRREEEDGATSSTKQLTKIDKDTPATKLNYAAAGQSTRESSVLSY
uniref:Uncharacterized protein n=1 Tax=Aureoumbra lagunensis TaxID=44058 RepID=A0A7S3JVZ9_9STRA